MLVDIAVADIGKAGRSYCFVDRLDLFLEEKRDAVAPFDDLMTKNSGSALVSVKRPQSCSM